MNMIVNSSDLVGYEAENLNKETTRAKALNKLVKAWESKQGRTAKKVGGLGLLAVSLAACNSEDTTPFSQSDVDAAVKTAVDAVDITSDNAAVLAQGIALGKQSAVDAGDAVDITSDNAAVLAQGIAAGKASVDITSDNAAAVEAALTTADGTVYANVDAAVAAGAATVDITSDNDAIVANAANSTLQAEAQRLGVTGYEVMTNSQIFAAIKESDNAQAVSDAVSAASGGAFNNVTTLFNSYTTLNNPTTTDFAAASTIANTTGNAADNNFTTTVVGAAATGTTLNPGDVFDGGAGTDTLSVAFSGNGGTLNIVGVDTVSVEKLMISNFDGAAGVNTIDATLMDGLTTIGTTASSANGDSAVSNIGAIVDAEMKSGTGDLTLTYVATAVAGTADSQNLTLANQTAGTFSAQGIETINVSSTVAANTVTLTSAQLTTVNVSGSTNVNLGTVDFANATLATSIDGTIDATNATGAVSFTAAADVYDVRGGSGNDTFTFGANLGTSDVIDGNGGTDTVSMTGVAAITGSTYGLTDVETFQVTTAADNTSVVLNAAGMTGVTTVRFDENIDTNNSGNENYTVNNLAAGQEVTFAQTVAGVDAGGTLTVALADASGSSDNVTVNLLGGAGDTAANNDLGGLSILNVETLNITSGSDSTTALGAADDNTLSTITTDATLGTLNLSGSDPLIVTVGASATGMTTINASGMTDTVSITPSNTLAGLTITGGSANDTIVMAAGLNNSDNINGGAGTDTVSGTITSATATTGALNISNVENVQLTNAGTATLNVAGITGGTSTAPTNIVNLGAATTTTITGIDAVNQTIDLGVANTTSAQGTFALTLADSTGSADNLTIDAVEVTTATITTSGVETLTVATSTTDTAIDNSTLTISGTNVANVVVTGANADTGHQLGLGTLDTETTSVDASGYQGQLTVAAAAATATTFTTHGTTVDSLTGSSSNDTFTISSTANVNHTVNGNGGTDTLNITYAAGAQNQNSITDVDTINMTIADSAAVTFDAAGTDADGINEATRVNILGGNSLSSVTVGGANVAASNDTLVSGTINTVIDASGFNGQFVGNFTADQGDNDVAGVTTQVIGGPLATDTVRVSYTGAGNPNFQINTQAVERLDITMDNTATQFVADMSLATGVTSVTTTDNSSESIRFNSVAEGITFTANSTNATASTIQVVRASSTGNADSQTFILGADDANDNVAITMADIETTNISGSTATGYNNRVDVELANVSMTASGATNTVNFTGTVPFNITNSNVDLATIDASGMSTGGEVDMQAAGRANTSAVNYTGSAGDDTFVFRHANDVMDGGAGSDTLDINYTAVLGGINIDLSATDQITSINGGANAAVVQNFENVDLAGFANFGAYVNGSSVANSITGTVSADQILGGAGADTITGGTGNDVLTGGTGDDIFTFSAAASNGSDTINDFTIGGTDDHLEVSAVDAQLNGTLQVGIMAANGTMTAMAGSGAHAAGNVDIVVMLDQGLADANAIRTEGNQSAGAITDSNGAIYVAWNTTSSTIEVYHNSNEAATAGTMTLLGSLSGSVVGDLSNFVFGDFA